MEKHYLRTSQLTVQAFHFHRNLSEVHFMTFVDTFDTALTILQYVDNFDKGTQLPAKPPLHVCYSVLLATHILLRLCKGPSSAYLDAHKAEDAFYLGLKLCQRQSNGDNDTFSKNVLILTQFWSSDRIFQTNNETQFIDLRIRSRLAMSCVFDHIVYWKREFGSTSSLAPAQRKDAAAGKLFADASCQ